MGEDRAPNVGGRDVEKEEPAQPALPERIRELRAKAIRESEDQADGRGRKSEAAGDSSPSDDAERR